MLSGASNAPRTNEPLGRPVAVYGLKLRTKAGSPEPVMTRQLCPAAEAAGAAGAEADAKSTAMAAARPAAVATPISRRVVRTSRRICGSFLLARKGRSARGRAGPGGFPATFPAVVTTPTPAESSDFWLATLPYLPAPFRKCSGTCFNIADDEPRHLPPPRDDPRDRRPRRRLDRHRLARRQRARRRLAGDARARAAGGARARLLREPERPRPLAGPDGPHRRDGPDAAPALLLPHPLRRRGGALRGGHAPRAVPDPARARARGLAPRPADARDDGRRARHPPGGVERRARGALEPRLPLRRHRPVDPGERADPGRVRREHRGRGRRDAASAPARASANRGDHRTAR